MLASLVERPLPPDRLPVAPSCCGLHLERQWIPPCKGRAEGLGQKMQEAGVGDERVKREGSVKGFNLPNGILLSVVI